MNVLVADDEVLALQVLVNAIKEAVPQANICAFRKVSELLACAKTAKFDIACLDIQMRNMNGIELARELKKINPQINIIFVTSYAEYLSDAFSLRASGYILKPVTTEAVKLELENLRNPITERQQTDKIYIHTFGNFEVFYKGAPIKFGRSKSKELFAYLVDRKGASVTMAEISAVLWGDKEYCRSLLNQIHSFLSDIMKQLKLINEEDIIIKERNSIAINVEKVECDYYNFLKGDVSTINAFTNEYMTNYSWAEFTVSNLNRLNKLRQ